MFRTVKTLALAGALAASTFVATSAQAGWIIGLVNGKQIVTIVPATRKVTAKADIKGAGLLLGIDVRPADGMLYGVTSDGTIWTIDAKTGQASMKSKMSQTLKPGVVATVDFNPVADRLRVMGSDGTNLRVNVDDGKVTTDGSHKFADTDMHKGEKPNIVAGAYTNSVKGAKETALYNIDATIGGLIKQAPPNDGTLNAVGKLGIKVDVVAFDIWSDGQGKNEAWLMAGDWLHSVDLAIGKATPSVQIKGVSGVRDIAILPTM